MNPSPIDRIQFRLLGLAGLFITLYAVALSLAPAVRARSWEVAYPWQHWLGWLAWLSVFLAAHRLSSRRLPERDPYLLAVVALLSGWGLLTIWRLDSSLGLKQSLWLLVCGAVLLIGMRLPSDFAFLRRYKYVWLTSGLLLTALTLFLGTNPLGYGPRLWLGCCGVYLQPSEPLKLLLITYLAAYLGGLPEATLQRFSVASRRYFNVLAPTFIMTGLALALLLAQRDLGTASVFLALYAAIVYTATGSQGVLLVSTLGLGLAALAGYMLFDVVRLRVDAWLNPWLDPSGRSYQIVQSLLAVASGGVVGRGPGLGSPGLVPVAASDFIFAAIGEEFGLLGGVAIFGLLAVLAARGMRIALNAPDGYRRYLAAGLTIYLTAQSVLIIGGNLRLLPLTGVTLPFVSYGGSSLLVAFVALLVLLKISERGEDLPQAFSSSRPILHLSFFLLMGLVAAALLAGWWAYLRGPALLTRTDNPRRAVSDRSVPRGALLDRNGAPLAETIGTPGNLTRHYPYPLLGPVVGYNHPTYGQSGLEASLDLYLRGVQGVPGLTIWWEHLLYGQPPPGLNVRLSLDLEVQGVADTLLGEQAGAVVVLNSRSGEILAMASHPAFDANRLEEEWLELVADKRSPLVNRALQGLYPAETALEGLFSQKFTSSKETFARSLGLYTAPEVRLPAASASPSDAPLSISPLQMALAAAVLNHDGQRPTPLLALAVSTPQAGWVLLDPVGQEQPGQQTQSVLSAVEAAQAAQALALGDVPLWGRTARQEAESGSAISWFVGGTLPEWQGAPLIVVVLLEDDNPALAERIGQSLLQSRLSP